MKVSELIKNLSEINSENEVVISIEYLDGDYGGHNSEKRAIIENIYKESDMFVLSGTEM